MAERKLVGTGEMFKKALAGKYAIGAYNVNNMEILQGIAEAAEETRSPIILQQKLLKKQDHLSFFKYPQVQENTLTKLT